MRDVFQNAASFELENDHVLEVETRGFGILSDRAGRYLFTRSVSDCSAIALLSQDGHYAAVAHVASRWEFAEVGQEKVAAHACRAWSEFETVLPDGVTFDGIIFGGWNSSMLSPRYPQTLAIASGWISDNFHQSALASPKIGMLQDLRFDGVRDSVVDLGTREIVAGRDEDCLNRKFPSMFENKRLALRYSCQWGLYPDL